MSTSEPAAAEARAPRRGRPGYDRRGLLNDAVQVFNRFGYDKTSIGLLSKNLGITKSAIYHHVPSKESLLEAALDEALDALEATLTSPGAEEGDAEARLRYAVRGTVLVMATHLPLVTLLLRLHGNSPVELAAIERRRQFDSHVTALVAEAAAEGSVRSDLDPAITSRLIFGTINSVVEWYNPSGRLSPDALADDVVTMVFDGVAAR